MLIRKFVSMAFVISLSGCAVAFHAANGTLGEVIGKPTTPTQVTVSSFGDGSGYQPTRLIEVPADVCDKDALLDGYTENYVQAWNEFVNSKVRQLSPGKTKVKGKAPAVDKTTAQNLALYNSYLIGTQQGTGYKQQSKRVPTGDACKSGSFAKGAASAMRDVEDERQKVIAKEVR